MAQADSRDAPLYGKLKRRFGLMTACFGATLLINGVPVYAESPADSISLIQAQALAQAALDACQARGFAASVSVVDAHGVVKVTLRADGAVKPPVAAPLKAATAVAFDQAGSDMEPREKSDPVFAALIAAHHDIYNAHPGSLPVHRAGGPLIGGLAVADVPHDIADACARAALARQPL